VIDLMSKIPREMKDDPRYKNLFTAIVWHDAIYFPGAKNNEIRSSELFVVVNSTNNTIKTEIDYEWNDADKVVDIIMATKDHEVINKDNLEEEVMIDLDLFGLSSDWPDYVANGRKIRKEFGEFSPEAWRNGRTAFIERFLAKDKIYKSGFFVNRELRARYNLECFKSGYIVLYNLMASCSTSHLVPSEYKSNVSKGFSSEATEQILTT